MAKTCKYTLDEGGINWACDREQENSDGLCIFHTKSGDADAIRDKFKSELKDGRSEFFGANLPELSLHRSDLDQIERLYLVDANIDAVYLNDSQITISIYLDHATIGTLNLSGSRLEFPVSATSSTITQCDFDRVLSESRVRLTGSEISGDAGFDDASIRILDINHLTVNGDLNLFSLNSTHVGMTGATVDGDTELSGARIGELHCHAADFKGTFEATRSTFEHATHFQFSNFHDEVDFGLSHLGGDVDFRRATFDSGAKFLDCEFSVCLFTEVSAYDELDFSASDFLRRVLMSLSDDSDCQVNMVYASFDGDLLLRGESEGVEYDLTGVNLRGTLRVDGLKAPSLIIDSAEIRSQIVMSNVEVRNLSISDSKFSRAYQGYNLKIEEFELTGSTLESDFWIIESEISEFVFDQGSSLADITVQSTEINNLRVRAAKCSGLHLHETKIAELLRLDQSIIESLHFDLVPHEGLTQVSLVRAEIDAGIIEHPEPNYALYDLTSATIGNISITSPDEMDPLSPLQFSVTDFSGFDFSNFRESLESNNWDFDSLDIEFPNDFVIEEIGEEEVGDFEEWMYPDVRNPLRSKQMTYMKAKNGAKAVGDNRTASEFFIKEMRYERMRLKDELKNSFPPVAINSGFSVHYEWFSALGDYLSNVILDISSGYGERLRRIGYWTIATVLGSAAFYAVTGGIKNTRTDTNVSIWSGDVYRTLIESVYFSIVTFTTLSYGDYQPMTMVSRMFAGFEALVGVFIVGIFIYSLGKKISR